MASKGLGHARRESAEVKLVSLLDCFQELIIECLGARSAFISGRIDCIGCGGVLKVPAEAARAWIRGMLSTPDQLQALNTSSLIRYTKVCCTFYGLVHLSWCGVRSSYRRVVQNVRGSQTQRRRVAPIAFGPAPSQPSKAIYCCCRRRNSSRTATW